MQSSLERLGNLDGIISSWKKNGNAEIFKDHIRQTLAYRHLNKECDKFRDYLDFEDSCKENNIPYDHILCFGFTDADWDSWFFSCTQEEMRILQFVFGYLYENCDVTDLSVEEFFENDSDGLIEAFELEDVNPDDIIEVWTALEKAAKNGCAENVPDAVEHFLDSITDMFSNVELSDSTLLLHLSHFTRFLYANEDCPCCTRAYASKEVYYYNSYKDMLPKDVRKKADMFVDIFRRPFTDKAFEDFNLEYFCVDIPEQEQTLVSFSTTYAGSSINEFVVEACDCKLLFRDALEYVEQELPLLRQKYGSREICSRTFLLQKNSIYASFCVFLRHFVVVVSTI